MRIRGTLAIVALLAAGAEARPNADKNIEAAPRGDAPITIDGRLDEPAWQSATPGSGFVQRSPVPGETPPVDGRVRVLYDAEALYVGIEFDLLDGETPRAVELTRDSFRVFSDDAVSLKFDVHQDRRSTVGLVVNPAGAQVDYVTLDSGGQFRREFDAKWEASSTVTDRVWTVEYRVPYVALGLPAKPGEQAMGFNVTRDHNRRNATDDWAPLPAELGPAAATHYGRISGLRDVGADGRPVAFIPFALVRHPGEDRLFGDAVDVRAGGDIRARLGEDLWAEATVLTDFAEVDLDDPQVNLDRFPLFLPEKRAFFLSGLDIFEFGQRGASQIFFSRRIGLDRSGGAVPLYGGLKMYGRAGGVGLGVLDVVTDGADGGPASNFAVARVSYPFGDGGQAGAIAVARHALDDRETTADHYAVGADGAIRLLDSRLQIAGFGAVTAETEVELPDGVEAAETTEPGTSGQLSVSYAGAEWQPEAWVRRTDADFAPAVGFVRRTDVVESGAELVRIFRFAEAAVSAVEVGVGAEGVWSADFADQRGRGVGGEVEISGRSGWDIELEGAYYADVVAADFELLPGLPVAAGTYEGAEVGISLSSPSTRAPSGYVAYVFDSGFFGGHLHEVYAGFTWAMGAHVRLFGDGFGSIIELPDAPVRRTLAVKSGVTLAASTRLFADVAAQINSVDDAVQGLVRLRWRYLPGSDLFAVYQEDLATADGIESAGRRITLKATWWVDALL